MNNAKTNVALTGTNDAPLVTEWLQVNRTTGGSYTFPGAGPDRAIQLEINQDLPHITVWGFFPTVGGAADTVQKLIFFRLYRGRKIVSKFDIRIGGSGSVYGDAPSVCPLVAGSDVGGDSMLISVHDSVSVITKVCAPMRFCAHASLMEFYCQVTSELMLPAIVVRQSNFPL